MYNDFYYNVGEKLRHLRKSKHLTQEEAVAKMGYAISRSSLSNYEINRRKPTISDLELLAKFYGVTLDYFAKSSKDESLALLSRAKKVFENPNITTIEKEQLYMEFMKLYLALKGNDEL